MTSRPIAGGGDLSAARKGRLRGTASWLTTLLEIYASTASAATAMPSCIASIWTVLDDWSVIRRLETTKWVLTLETMQFVPDTNIDVQEAATQVRRDSLSPAACSFTQPARLVQEDPSPLHKHTSSAATTQSSCQVSPPAHPP